MAGIDMTEFLKLMGELQTLDVESLKYTLRDSFTGKFDWPSSLNNVKIQINKVLQEQRR